MNVDDLHQAYGNVPALRVKSGKGAKARMVPFGDMLWARQIVEIWLDGREARPNVAPTTIEPGASIDFTVKFPYAGEGYATLTMMGRV